MEPTIDPDLALVERCYDPNSDEFEAAFEALYTRYRDRVYSIAFRITGNSTDAMDVVQEAFSLLFRKISGFRGEAQFSTWLFRIVVNCAIDCRRQKRSGIRGRTASLEGGAVLEPEQAGTGSPSEVAEHHELGDHLHHSLQRISPKLRAVLVLRYMEHQSYEQLSATLEMSMGTVKSRLARAHVALEKVLEGTLAPFGFEQGGTGGSDQEAGGSAEGVA